jgi:Uma2 family endonuclease
MTLAPPSSAPPASGPPASGPTPDSLDAVGLPPLLLPLDLRLSPEQFALVCAANPEAVLELAADGQLITMTPTGGDTSARNSLLIARLQIWALGQGGWKVFDSSGGFRLPDGSVLSPDASVVRDDRWQALSPEQRRGFPPLCPDLVIELASPSDAGPRGATDLRRKMAAYLANGAQLGWLLFPERQAVEIWRAPSLLPVQWSSAETPDGSSQPERLEPADTLEGGETFPGLRLELAELWAV